MFQRKKATKSKYVCNNETFINTLYKNQHTVLHKIYLLSTNNEKKTKVGKYLSTPPPLHFLPTPKNPRGMINKRITSTHTKESIISISYKFKDLKSIQHQQ